MKVVKARCVVSVDDILVVAQLEEVRSSDSARKFSVSLMITWGVMTYSL